MVGFRLEAELRLFPCFFPRFEVEGDSPVFSFRDLGGGRGHVVPGFLNGRLPRCYAYSMG